MVQDYHPGRPSGGSGSPAGQPGGDGLVRVTRPLGCELTAEDVVAYLREHPDFLTRRLDLLPLLVPPARRQGDGVVDFQVHLLDRLRGELGALLSREQEVLATARANQTSQARVHAAALALMDAASFEHLIQTVTTDLALLLDLDVAGLVLEATGISFPHAHRPGLRVVEVGGINRLLDGERRDVVLRASMQGPDDVFGPGAGLVRSMALARLRFGGTAPAALLALGSREPDAFHPGQGTDLVNFLARVLERAVRRWLDLPGE